MKTVLEKGGTFSGVNRKVQIKPTKWSDTPNGQVLTLLRRCSPLLAVGVVTHRLLLSRTQPLLDRYSTVAGDHGGACRLEVGGVAHRCGRGPGRPTRRAVSG